MTHDEHELTAKEEFEALLIYFREQYHTVFLHEIQEETFIFRPLSKSEYTNYVVKADIKKELLDETLCELCVLYPEDYDFSNCKHAGIPANLAQEILAKSGFRNEEALAEIIADYRARVDDDDFYVQNIILAAFPHLRPEEIETWNIYQTLDYFVRAEWIIENMMPLLQLPGDDEEEHVQSQQSFHAQRPPTMGP